MGLARHSFGNRCQTDAETLVTAGAPADTPRSADASSAPVDTVVASTHRQGGSQAAAEANVAAEWKVGDIILDLYEVKQVHEGGGMGLVYRVDHRGWNTDLAVKSPRQEHFQTEAQRVNFSRECETWIKLGLHPHVVSCYYVRKLGGIPRVFAEYVQGGSLKEWIDSRRLYEGGPYEALKRVLDIAIQTAWGLQHAHTQGVIHQDVKPANVLLTPEGIAKVTDFGLARARAVTGEPAATDKLRSILVSHGGMTPAYCSPEQARKEPVTRKTDIWSWAVSLLEMFVGEVCWQSGVAAPEALERLEELRLAEAGPPQMPAALRDFLRECLAQNPVNRPKDMEEMGRRIREIFFQATGGEYWRTEVKAAKLSADSLNNQAVSLLDLGRQEEAESLLEKVIQATSGHLEATYNFALVRWREGRMDDQESLEILSQANVPEELRCKAALLQARVLLEADDCEGAISTLGRLEPLDAAGTELVELLCLARGRLQGSRRCLHTLVEDRNHAGPHSMSADGRWVVSGHSDGRLRLWEVSSGRCVRSFDGHDCGITSVSVNADARWALSGGKDGALRLWEVSSGRSVRTFMPHHNYIEGVCESALDRDIDRVYLSADGLWALVRSWRVLSLCDVSSGRCMWSTVPYKGGVCPCALSADGHWVLSWSDGHALKLMEAASGRCVRTLTDVTKHASHVSCVCLSDDARWALSGSHELQLWDLLSGKCMRTWKGHTGGVRSVCLSADGRWALSGGGDRTLKLWDLFSGRCLRTFKLSGPVSDHSACLSADAEWHLRANMVTG